ncbi:MAG: hypothetical protein AAGA10_00900 [Bacteroidota bacterium]
MKSLKLTFLTLTLLFCFACESEDTVSPSSETLSTDDAAEIVSSSVSDNSAGLNAMVSDIVRTTESSLSSEMESPSNGCGYQMDTVFSTSNPSGTVSTYSFQFAYAYEIQCKSNNIPEFVAVSSSYEGTYDGPRLVSDNTGIASFSMSGFPLTQSAYIINGVYERSGDFESRVRNMTQSNSTVSFDLSALSYDKQLGEISSGTASLSLSGTLKSGESYSYMGSLSFEGNGVVILTLNGEIYTIDLRTGEIS